MRYIILLILSTISVQLTQAQINELGLYLGGSNFIGDVGATTYIAPNKFTIGGIYKWNRTSRHSYRASLLFTTLKGEDAESDDPRRAIRGFEFSNQITELSLGMEFNFIDFNLHSGRKIISPYLYSGLALTRYDGIFIDSGRQIQEEASNTTFGIPMVLGVKTTFLDKIILAFEVGARYTFTDRIDGNISTNSANSALEFGNVNNNDWYMFTGLTLTYTFGINPCYCVN